MKTKPLHIILKNCKAHYVFKLKLLIKKKDSKYLKRK